MSRITSLALGAGVAVLAVLGSCASLAGPAPVLRPGVAGYGEGPASVVTVPLKVPMAAARQWAESAVPPVLQGEGSGQQTLSAWFVKRDWHYWWNYHLKRTPLQISFAGPKIRVSTGLTGELYAKWDTLEGDITADVEAVAGAEAELKLGADWKLTPQAKTFLDVRRADVPIGISWDGNFFGETISIARPIRGALEPALTTLNADLNRWLSSLDLKPAVEGLWREAQEPRSLAADNRLWFSLGPSEAAFGALSATAETLSLPVTLTVHPVLTVGARPDPVRRPLPAAGGSPGVPGALTVTLPVALDWDEAARRALQALPDRTVRPPAGGRILVTGLAAATDANRVVLKLEGKVFPPWPGPAVDALLWLTGVPKWDPAARVFRVTDVTFEAKTKDVLVQGAAWLLAGGWTDQLEKTLVFSLAGPIEEVRTQVNRSLADLSFGPRFSLNASADRLEVLDFVLTDRGPQMLTRLTGRAEAVWKP